MAHGDEHAVHSPQPSISPPLIGLGVLLLTLGVLFGVALLVAGAFFFVLGLATWLIDDAQAFARAREPEGPTGRGH